MKPEYIYMNVIAPLFILVPIITLFTRFKALPSEGKILLCYLITDMLVSATSSALAFNHIRNLPLYHIATIIETMMLLYFFYFVFHTRKSEKYLKSAILLFPVLGLINIIFFQHIYQFNSYMLSLQSIIIIVLCFLYWWHHENDTETKWSAIPLNWIISGLLIYFSSTFILLTFSNMIISSSKSVSIMMWNIHATLTIIMYLLLSIGISKYKT